jgi:TRAP-type C4-dicarboxylate transport system substrate-binding protein
VLAKTPIRHLADFKGKKIRVLASPFQSRPMERLGATPVAMTLGDVLPAMQQGAIDGAIGGIVVWTPMHFSDAAKYVTETGQPAVYAIAEISKKWYDSLPADLQKLIDEDAKGWTDAGGELISLPADEQAEMMKTFAGAAADVASTRPALADAYKIVTEAAARTQ